MAEFILPAWKRVEEEERERLSESKDLDRAVLDAADAWERYDEDDCGEYEKKLEKAVRARREAQG